MSSGHGIGNPYVGLDESAFWATAVAQKNMFDIGRLWSPAFRIDSKDKVVTFGSCFAQHIGRALKSRGFNWHITERAPSGLSPKNASRFNYGIFSSRTGNIYTVSQLEQWIDWSTGGVAPPQEVWVSGDRYFDPFRPNIEPNGFCSAEEVRASREVALECFERAIKSASVFVFTMGLTESWVHTTHGYEYPMCPGTVAGEFSPDVHQFINQDYPFIRQRLVAAIRKMRAINPGLRVLLTVSPVPLTATMSGNHVLVATMESKSILRAVSASVARQLKFVDYFPSYEIISSSPYRGTFFEPNQRGVNAVGVAHVMNNFFKGLSDKFPGVDRQTIKTGSASRPATDTVCEEELLGAFAREARSC